MTASSVTSAGQYNKNCVRNDLQFCMLRCFVLKLNIYEEGGGENRMQKPMSKKALAKEAAYWNALKQMAKMNPGMVCHK